MAGSVVRHEQQTMSKSLRTTARRWRSFFPVFFLRLGRSLLVWNESGDGCVLGH